MDSLNRLKAEHEKHRSDILATRMVLEMASDHCRQNGIQSDVVRALMQSARHTAIGEWGDNTTVHLQGAVAIVENLDGRKFVFDLQSGQEIKGAA